MALKQASKRIIISDESVNSKEFWTLTQGIDLSMYNVNPVMLWNHNRPKSDDAKHDDILPIGIFMNLSIDANGVMSGLPAFDDTDPFAMRIYEKYEAGIVNMASAGLQPLQVLTDKKHLKGKAPCLSKSLMAEISLTDIGSNRNAVKLYDNGKEIQLTNGNDLIKLFFSTDNNEKMLIKLTDFAAILKLADTATEQEVLEAIKKNNEALVKLTADLSTATTKYDELVKSVKESKIQTLVDAAVTSKKITAAQKDQYIKLAGADYESVQSILDSMKPYESLEHKLSDEGKEINLTELNSLIKLSGEELFKSGSLDKLKTLSLAHYKIKYKDAFGVEAPE